MILAGAGAFVSCKNNASDSSDDAPKAPLSETATVSEVDEVATTGTSASVTGSVATLSASNGTYILTPYQETSGNISADVAPSTTGGGKWKFTETGNTIAKYAGNYTGSIETIGASDTTLKLNVEKILNKEGLLTAVVEEKSIDMTVSSSGTFEATIPAVKVSSVTSYIKANIFSSNAVFERMDLSNGKHTISTVWASDSHDTTYLLLNGTYTIADGKFTDFNREYTYKIDDDGNLFYSNSDSDNLAYRPVCGSCKTYVNIVAKLDDKDYFYGHIKTICLKEDSGKTGQFINLTRKDFDGQFGRQYGNETVDTKDITYTISGDTITFTGVGAAAGYSKTATLSADGKTLTLDGVDYRKM